MRAAVSISLLAMLTACPSEDQGDDWQLVGRDLDGALMSVWAGGPDDVWAVGADSGAGPAFLHYDGQTWQSIPTGTVGDLWWVHGFANDGPIFAGGEGGVVLRYDRSTIVELATPGASTVFGLWGASPSQMWAVGGNQGGASGAFAWRLEGDAFVEVAGFPTELASTDAIWKIFGRAENDVILVGTGGTILRHDGADFTTESSGASVSLFTVHGDSERLYAVGGFGTGVILENDGGGWQDVSPSGATPLIGVSATADGSAYAVGHDGVVYHRDDDGSWLLEQTKAGVALPLHGACVDSAGGVWAVGGQVLAEPLVRGYLVHKGDPLAEGIGQP